MPFTMSMHTLPLNLFVFFEKAKLMCIYRPNHPHKRHKRLYRAWSLPHHAYLVLGEISLPIGFWIFQKLLLLLLSPSAMRSLLLPLILSWSLATDGFHLNFVVVQSSGFVDLNLENPNESTGYIPRMIRDVALLANFTYDLPPPSGWGLNCVPQRTVNTTEYNPAWATNYNCGQEDVLNNYGAVPIESVVDAYWSMYFITPLRLFWNSTFSIPFKPPSAGLTMYGTATGISNMSDLVQQQDDGTVGKVCSAEYAEYTDYLFSTFFPSGKGLVQIENTVEAVQTALSDGTCDVMINAEFAALRFVKEMAMAGTCLIGGKPVGIIGDSLPFGLTQMAVGWRSASDGRLPNLTNEDGDNIPVAINKGLSALMYCPTPGQFNFNCTDVDEPLYPSFEKSAGNGQECGYVPNPPTPPPDPLTSGATMRWRGAMSAITIALVALIL